MALGFSTFLCKLGNGITELHAGTVDPSAGAGVVAPVNSFYFRTDQTIWFKFGAADADWRLLTFTSALPGMVTASGGGTENFARADGSWSPPINSSPGWFGSGQDGDATITGGTTLLGRDMFYNNLTVTSTGVIGPQGYRINVAGTLTIDASGVIGRNGSDGAGTVGGSGVTGQTLGGSTAGGNGGGAGAGVAGGAITQQPLPLPLTGATSGRGGAGGLGPSGGGAASGTISQAAASLGGPWFMPFIAMMAYPQSTSTAWPGGSGGGGGGGGGGGAAGNGGGGGGGGGVVSIAARTLINNGTIRANGGAGAAAAGTNAGGGGGGGGGKVGIFYRTLVNTGSITASGGTGGAKTGTGVVGSDGSTGLVLQFQI